MDHTTLVTGTMHVVFDEKIGPTARSWRPLDLEEAMREKIALLVMNLTSNMEDLPDDVAVIPISTYKLKALVQFIRFKDESLRGGMGEAALVLLYDERHDGIYYKYLEHFERVFTRYKTKTSNLHHQKAPSSRFDLLLDDFGKEIHELLETLEQEEKGMHRAASAFPQSYSVQRENQVPYKFKIAVCGDPGVGKTSLVLQFTDKAFRKTYLPTIGVNITEKNLETSGTKVKFVLWDIAGQVKFTTMRHHFYTGAAAVIIVFDLTRLATLDCTKAWLDDIRAKLGDDVQAVLIGNKVDLEHQREVSNARAREMATALDVEYMETSARTGKNVDKLFHEFAKKLTETQRSVES